MNFYKKIALSTFALAAVLFALPVTPAQANTCAISVDTVVNQAYVTAGGCTAIEIQGNVSTTWSGTVDLGGGTVTVKTGNTMTMGVSSQMVLGSNDDFVVETNATATHVVADPAGLQITARNITISGSLDVSAKGCSGGATTGAVGQGPNTTTGVCGASVSGYGLANGGSAAHGGAGGNGWQASTAQSATYGSSTAPSLLGSGGGSAFVLYGGGPGGNGGGRIALTATGDLTVNGTIFAKGGAAVVNSDASSGAGSGGSIYVRVAGTFDGSGSLSAAGGSAVSNGGNGSGSGGGGRLALYYGTLGTFSLGNAVAPRGAPSSGSTNGRPGDAGSTFILNRYTDDGAGDLRITSGLSFVTGVDYSRDLITVDSGALLTCGAQTTLTISSASVLTADGTTWSCASVITTVNISAGTTLATAGSMWAFGASGAVNITATTWSTGAASSTLVVSQAGSRSTWAVTNDLDLRQFKYVGASTAGFSSSAGGRLDIVGAIDLALASSTLLTSVSSTQLTSLAIDSDSFIRADGRGCAGGLASTEAAGPNTTTGVCGLSTSGYGRANGGGAGHAGIGGVSWTGTVQSVTYGSSTYPILFGSGGGTAFTGYGDHPGGNGGGTINLVVSGPLTLNGQISANGSTPTTAAGDAAPGGGSGGSVYIRASTVTGSATITANGGSGQSAGSSHAGGGGGGGRVALLYSDLSGYSLGFITANGGTKGVGGGSATDGVVGSIYSLQTNQAPNVPAELRPTSLVNGSTTGTGTPMLTFTLSDLDVLDTNKFQIQIDDSADFGSPVVDYTSALGAQGARSFQVGQAQGGGTYSVGSSGQTLASGSYYWRVKTMDAVLAESSYATANSGLAAFIVDTASRTVAFELDTYANAESVTSTIVRLVLNTIHFENVSVGYAVVIASSTALPGDDYTLADGTATILAGQTSTTISLAIEDDQIAEVDETVVIALISPVFASVGGVATTTYTVTDNDVAGVTASSVTGSAVEGAGSATYTLVLDAQPTSTVSIVLDADLSQVSLSTSTIYFTTSDWSTPQTITVSAVNDQVSESSFATSVTHLIQTTGLYGYTSDLAIGNSTISVTDNDVAGVTVSPTSLSLAEGGASSTYTLVLTSQPTSTIRITLTASAQVTVSTSSIEFTSDTWSTPQTVTINATQDTSQEGAHSGTVTHAVTVPSGYAYGFSSGPSISTITATIADDETASIAVSASSLSIIEGRSGSFTVLLGTAPTTTVEVLVTAGSGLAVSSSTVAFDASSYATPVTITVTPVNDSVYIGNRSSLVSLTVSTTAGGYAALTLSDVTIAIVEDERTGGGAVGGGPGGGSVSPIAFIVPVVQSTQIPVVSLPPAPPIITVVPELPTNSTLLPASPGTTEVVTILNPSDVLSLVRATQSSRNFEREGIVIGRLVQDLTEMRVTATEAQKLSLSNFITYGISERTHALGEGERRALVRDALETMRTANISPIDIERLTRGLIPGYRNLVAERAQVKRAQTTFRSIYGRDPNFKNAEENLAWNTLMYRIRFPRDLAAEQEGIQEFRRLFGRAPRDPFQWATVRVLGYVR